MKKLSTTTIAIVLIVLATLSLSACETRILGIYIGLREPSITPTPTNSTPKIVTPTPSAPTPSPTPEASIITPEPFVCFGNNIKGTVWIRDCPGIQCATLGTLATGEQVKTNGNRKDDVTGTTWLQLTSPIEGWVSIRYICEAESEQP